MRVHAGFALAVAGLVLMSGAGYCLDGDVNLDGIVDANDLLMVQENWHQGLGQGGFSNSQKCAACHREIYEKWDSSLHSQIYRATSEVANANWLPPWTGQAAVSSGGISVTGTLDIRGDDEHWVTIHFADGDREYQVDRVHGGIAIDENEDPRAPNKPGHAKYIGKQRYHTHIGEGYYILPFQWNPIPNLDGNNQGWVAYHPEHWSDVDGNFVLNLTTRSEEKRCAGCHQTGVKPTFNEATQQFSHNASEPNISCENCHGPGAAHVASQDPEDIVNPTDLATAKMQNESCGHCHSRGSSVGQVAGMNVSYPYANGRTYRPGDDLADFYDFNSPGNHWPDGISQKHHQQYEDYLLSKHSEEGITCWACHDPHGSDFEHDLIVTARDNSLCLRCHEDGGYDTEAHTHHGAPGLGNENPNCVDCHMPAVQKSAVRYDIHAHSFEVLLPQTTLDHEVDGGSPNSCALCHTEENGAIDPDIASWDDPEDIVIATYLDGFADMWWGGDGPPVPTVDDTATYLGSDACLGCHTNMGIVSDTSAAEGWQNSLHSQIYRDPQSPEAEYLLTPAEWTGTHTVSGGGVSVTATLEIRNTDERWFVLHFAGGDDERRVDRVHGGHAVDENIDARDPNRPGGRKWIGKQRYHTQIGSDHYIIPFQYNPEPDLDGKNQGWVAYHPEHWVDGSNNKILNLTTRSESRRCAGCHQTGVQPSVAYNAVVDATQYAHNAAAPNIGCENCHGPGSKHAAMTANPTGERGIILPSLMENNERRLETCGQCHARGSSVGKIGGNSFGYPHNGERTYIPGDDLSEFYTDGGGDWPDGTSSSHHQQYFDFLASDHWKIAKQDCWVCHDPHGSTHEHDLKMSARDNGLCLQCHEGMDSTEHTHHSTDIAGGSPRCVDCHMAAVQKSGVRFDIHAHTFKVLLPSGTLAFQESGAGQPNACALCHRTMDDFTDEDIAVWNSSDDIAIATILDDYVKQWWPGSLAKELDEASVKLFKGADLTD